VRAPFTWLGRRPTPGLGGQRSRTAAVLLSLAIGVFVLGGCSGGRLPVATGVVRILSTPSVEATPTLEDTGGVAVYVPIVVQGIPLEPTATATRDAQSQPGSVLSTSVSVVSAISRQRAGPEGTSLEVEGEVRNDGQVAVQAVRVLVEATSENKLCGRGALTLLGKAEAVLAPGDTWPFGGIVYLDSEAEEVAFEVVAVETELMPVRLSVEEATVHVSEEGDWLVSGSLRNSFGQAISYPRVVLTLRAADGSYLASGLAYAGVSTLVAGEVVPFQVTVARDRVQGWASYAVVGTGERQ